MFFQLSCLVPFTVVAFASTTSLFFLLAPPFPTDVPAVLRVTLLFDIFERELAIFSILIFTYMWNFALDSLGCETVQRKTVFRGICIIHITVEQPFALGVDRHLLVKGFQRFRASFLIHDLRGFGSLLVKTRGQLISIRRWCQ